MSAPTAVVLATSRTHGDDDLVHVTCCDDDRALCGADCSDTPECDEDWTCVVCLDLAEAPCTPGCDW